MPSHLFVQAGVGGLAARWPKAAWACKRGRDCLWSSRSRRAGGEAWPKDAPRWLPAHCNLGRDAACGLASPRARYPVAPCGATGPVGEEELVMAVRVLRRGGPATTPSRMRLAGLLHVAVRPELAAHGLNPTACAGGDEGPVAGWVYLGMRTRTHAMPFVLTSSMAATDVIEQMMTRLRQQGGRRGDRCAAGHGVVRVA